MAAVSPTHGTVACFFISASRSRQEATSSLVMMPANRIRQIIIQNPGTALLKSIAVLPPFSAEQWEDYIGLVANIGVSKLTT